MINFHLLTITKWRINKKIINNLVTLMILVKEHKFLLLVLFPFSNNCSNSNYNFCNKINNQNSSNFIKI